MKTKKRLFALLLAMMLCIGCLQVTAFAAEPDSDIVVLYTNDVHCGIDKNIGYAGLAAYKSEMEAAGNYVTLVDVGDAIQGDTIGTLSKGSYIIDIMNAVGYDIAIPGNHEFDYGMDQFFALTEQADFPYLATNFVDLRTGEAVFYDYAIIPYGDVNVAYIGIATPESFTKSTPTYFQDENGNYIYGFCEGNNGQDLYDAVQASVDAAKADGADYVVALGHLGVDEQSSPWMSTDVIANTTGIDVFLDGHSHSTIPSQEVANKNGETVLLSSTGTKLEAIGKLTISQDGISTELITNYEEKDPVIEAFVNDIKSQYEELVNTVVATTNVTLTTEDPVTGKRIVRHAETNLGDLCADAYRIVLGADIAFVNGGGVRANIEEGDITYGDIISVHPFGNMACVIEATGQQILEALELGASAYPGESGGFLQVSGMSYQIDPTVPSPVILDDHSMFVGLEGENRVKNVMIGGEPLDLTKTYTLASHNYMLKNAGDGYSMFQGCNLLQDEVLIDNQVLINYIVDELNGVVGEQYANPYGEGRITIYAGSDTPDTGDSFPVLWVAVLAAGAAGIVIFRKKANA